MLLGVLPDSKYPQVTIKLEEDELLVLYSDGIEGAFAARHLPSADTSSPIPPHFTHLASMRRGEAAESLDAAMEYLAESLDSQAGSFHQDDDLTVLAFQTLCVEDPLGRPAIEDESPEVTRMPEPALPGDPIR